MYPMSLYESGESTGSVSLMNLFDGKPVEWEESKLSIDDMIYAICRGGWPQSIDIENKEAALSIASDLFYQTCHVDISNISHVKRNPLWAERLLRSYSRNICTLAETKTIIADASSSSEMSKPTFYEYFHDLEDLYIIDELPAWCPAIRSKEAIRAGNKRNLIDPSIAVAALGLSPQYFNTDFKTLGFLFESLCIRDLKIYSSGMNGEVSYYHDRYGLEADAVLHLKDGRYALIEFKLGSKEIDMGAEHLCEIERLIIEYNKKEKQVPLRLPDLKLIITATEYGYKREDGVYVIPIGCLKN
jgi:predicted AAA+ superfamily ATPase